MSTFDPHNQNFFRQHYAKWWRHVFKLHFWALYLTYRKTNGTIGFLRAFCIRNMYFFSKFYNFKVWPVSKFYRLPACFCHIHRITDCIKGAETRKLLALFNGYWLQISSDMTLNIRSQVMNNGAMVSIIRRRRQIFNTRRHRPFRILPRNKFWGAGTTPLPFRPLLS